MQTRRFDFVVLGSGSTAFAAAIRAAELENGRDDREPHPGRTCVNRGCLALQEPDCRGRHNPQGSPSPISRNRTCATSFRLRQARRAKGRGDRLLPEKKYQGIVGDRISVLEGTARFVDRNAVQVGDTRLEAHSFLVATGSRPFIAPIKGLDTVPFMMSDFPTSQESLELVGQPESLTIIGGGYIALGLGQFFRRLGTRVTVLEPSERILPAYEPEIAAALGQTLEQEGITILTRAKAAVVGKDREGISVGVEGNASTTVRSSHLLVATGRVPNSRDLGLEKAGVGVDEAAELRSTKICGPRRPTYEQPVT
jgi:mercuric reductase